MKNLLPLIFLLVGPFLGKAQQSDPSTLHKTGDNVPAFTFSIDKNQTASIADYRGKIVLINFFATWCGPCRMELPRVQKEIWEKYKDNSHFAMFVFGREQDWNVVLPFKAENNYTFPILPDVGRKIFSLFATQAIPRSILIDEQGKIIYQSIGYSPEEFNDLLTILASRLNKSS